MCMRKRRIPAITIANEGATSINLTILRERKYKKRPPWHISIPEGSRGVVGGKECGVEAIGGDLRGGCWRREGGWRIVMKLFRFWSQSALFYT